jgi:hypothetical protein
MFVYQKNILLNCYIFIKYVIPTDHLLSLEFLDNKSTPSDIYSVFDNDRLYKESIWH